jgi:putative peptidoglycan lipid II flippase
MNQTQTHSRTLSEPLDRTRSFAGAAMMGLFMLVSRCLGLLRDINTVAVMGMSGSLAMDAFACAFRIPNIARRFFEEGIIGLPFIPVFSQWLKTDRRRAWRLAARYLFYGTLFGLATTVVLELTAALAWIICKPPEGKLWYNILRFGTLMFPYLIFVFPAAQAAATLQGLGRFRMAGFMPVLFNVVWLAALFFVSPFGIYLPFKVPPCTFSIFGVSAATLSPIGRGAVLSLAIAGVSALQFLVLFLYLLFLRRRAEPGIFDPNETIPPEVDRQIRDALRHVWQRLVPMALVVLFLPLNMLLATLLAALFSGTSVPVFSAIPGVDALFAGTMGRGAASALYFGERLYEFPLALVGITVATAFYPLLTRRALEKDRAGYAVDFTAALQLIGLLAIPAGAGLVMLSEPLSHLFFAHGAANPEDSARIARLSACFGYGVPAFCLAAFLNRALLALGDLKTPLCAGIFSVVLFLVSALLGVLWWGEVGLALAITVSSCGQTTVLACRAVREISHRQIAALERTLLAAVVGSTVMICGILAERYFLTRFGAEFGPLPLISGKTVSILFGIAADLTVGILVFFAVIFLFDRKKTLGMIKSVARNFFGRKGRAGR